MLCSVSITMEPYRYGIVEWMTNKHLFIIYFNEYRRCVHANIYSQLAQTRFGSCDGIEYADWIRGPTRKWHLLRTVCLATASETNDLRLKDIFETTIPAEYAMNEWRSQKIALLIKFTVCGDIDFISFRNANEVKLRHFGMCADDSCHW